MLSEKFPIRQNRFHNLMKADSRKNHIMHDLIYSIPFIDKMQKYSCAHESLSTEAFNQYHALSRFPGSQISTYLPLLRLFTQWITETHSLLTVTGSLRFLT